MNENVKAPQPETRGTAFALGLNPYGLTYHLGLQGAGGPRANPDGAGLEDLSPSRPSSARRCSKSMTHGSRP